MPDAVVVGAGPNGLAAAIALARAGRSVRVLEAAETIGGGSRSAELTLPGFTHDVCSAVHPHPLASPFLRELPLAEHGLELVQPELPLAHPLDDGTAVASARSIDETAASIGGADGDAYRKLVAPLVRDAEKLLPAILGPLRPTRHPLALTRFGLLGLPSAKFLARRFDDPRARALIAGHAAHSMLRLDRPPTVGGRARAHPHRPPRRLAGRARRLAGGRRRARLARARPRRGDRHRPPRRARRRARRRGRRAVRPHPAPGRRAGRPPAAGPLPPRARALPLRPRRLQARLGARRPDPVDGAGLRAGGHGARRRHVRGARGERGGRDVRAARRAPVRAALPADGLRPQPRAGGQARRLGLLPRAVRLGPRHDRARSSARSSASRPASATASWPARR